MALKEECINCLSYNPANGLCTKKWIVPEWDGQKCSFTNGTERSNEVSTVQSLGDHTEEIEKKEDIENQEDIQPKRQRHGCATFWLSVILISNSVQVIYYLSKIFNNVDFIESCISVVIGVIVVLSLILMFRWNKIGIYIYVAIHLLAGLVCIISGEYTSMNAYILPLTIMACVFSLKAKDNKTYFENVGINKK